ncbi:MAG: hypothetical protein LBD67_01920 [Candidatus Accumulibacter sp.]|nr:hypothetical protein [Accumulibacter sp.]
MYVVNVFRQNHHERGYTLPMLRQVRRDREHPFMLRHIRHKWLGKNGSRDFTAALPDRLQLPYTVRGRSRIKLFFKRIPV